MIVAEQTSRADAAADWPAPTARADAAETNAAQRARREVVSGQQDTQRDDGQRVTHDGSVALGPLYTIAALYVDPNGVYSNLPGVEVWDEQRDARLYEGPWPVVAHPPCARWSVPLAYVNQTRYGYKVGDDGGCFEAALHAVRTFGGVLEHPRDSIAWTRFGLPRPRRGGWTTSFFDPGVTTAVDQHVYGHPCKKETWLYYVGDEPCALAWAKAPPGLPVVSWLRGAAWYRENGRKPITRSEASKTPVAFRDVLIQLARSAALHNLPDDPRSRRLPRERGKVADVNGLTTPPAGARPL